MICNNCNSEISDSSIFCNFCGTRVDSEENKQISTNIYQLEQESENNVISVDATEEKTKNSFRVGLIVSTLIILSIMLLVIGQMTEYTFSYSHYNYLKHVKKDADGNNALFKSIINNDLINTKRIIDLGVDLDTTNNNNDTALIIAVRNRNLDIVKALLENGANTEIKDSDFDTPLLIGAAQGDIDVCNLLIDYGANINVENSMSEDPFIIAVKRGDKSLVEKYIEKNININKKDSNKDTALLLAAKLNQRVIFKLLLDHGASFTDKDENGDSVFNILGRNKDEESMNLLVEKRKTDLLSSQFQKEELTGSGFASVSFISFVIPDDEIYDFYAEDGIKILYNKNGHKLYEGEIKNGRITGFGTAFTTNDDYALEPNQIIYQGNWVDGVWNGSGSSYWVKYTLDDLKSRNTEENALILYKGYNNTIFYKTNYINGYRDGSYTRYFSDGTYNDTGVARAGNNIYDVLPAKLKPSIGMNKQEAKNSSWGEPKDINTTTTVYGTWEQWVYDNFNYLYFENGLLVAIQD